MHGTESPSRQCRAHRRRFLVWDVSNLRRSMSRSRAGTRDAVNIPIRCQEPRAKAKAKRMVDGRRRVLASRDTPSTGPYHSKPTASALLCSSHRTASRGSCFTVSFCVAPSSAAFLVYSRRLLETDRPTVSSIAPFLALVSFPRFLPRLCPSPASCCRIRDLRLHPHPPAPSLVHWS